MKIALFSDLHIEHRRGEYGNLIEHIISTIPDDVDLIVNSGDTHHHAEVRASVKKLFTEMWPKVPYIEVMGNHDLYGGDWALGGQIQVHSQSILSASLWTNFNNNEREAAAAELWINDFRQIYGVSAEEMTKRFNRTLRSIEEDKPEIVITHFAPSPHSIHPRWLGSDVNSYFCPNAMDRLTHKPKLWLHGHIHDPVDYCIDHGKDSITRVVANPLGYPGETYRHFNDYSAEIIEV